jgi:hypothetical protein
MARYLALGKQSSWDTAATSFKYVDPLSISISPERDIVQLRPVSSRFATAFYPGGWKVTGDIEFPCNPQTIGDALLMIFGQVSSQSQGTGAYKHTFTPIDVDSAPPVYTLEIASGSVYRQILNVAATSLEIEFPPNEIVSTTLSILGTKEQAGSSRTPAFPSVRDFTGADAAVKINNNTRKLRALSLTINANLSDDHYVLGSRYLPRHILGEFEVTGSMDIEFEEESYLDEFLAESEASFEITLTGPQIESGVNYQLKLTMPKVIYETWEAEVSHAEPIVQSIDFVARKDGSNPVITAELINTITSY